ncbi:hypothetical protein BJ138DRAFT_1160652 [Hygrophoropsis aurantiaca]|uniref:Uncharacterized protein n=1 Tax=Hygrophoropsis aurantiaca TaxID=72124 RepID=A0ACB8A215_9AGAM|nr:hypothetical protein BJ138DRAFT_1160652 [Hygrophoropsis aurantiaca]
MFVSRILPLLALSMLAAATCELGLTEACCWVYPASLRKPIGATYGCLPFYNQCLDSRSLVCCKSILGDGDGFDCTPEQSA